MYEDLQKLRAYDLAEIPVHPEAEKVCGVAVKN